MILRQSTALSHVSAFGAYVASAALLLAATLLAATLTLLTAAPGADAAARGIVDNRLEYHGGIDLTPVASYAAEMGSANLRAKWTRVFAYWDQLQPYAPGESDPGDLDGDGYNDAYLAELEYVVSSLHAQGMQVILSGSDPPDWARDERYRSYWQKNPTAAVVDMGDAEVRSAFQSYAAFLAAHFQGEPYGVTHFEVWNEPNLRLIPQIVDAKVVGPEVYRKMLIAFAKGAHAANPGAVVIAGATSRMGSPGTKPGSTSPQWFARYLKKRGARQWFDAYSHHPYSTRKSRPAPAAQPRRPDISVTLGNLSVLLKIFPRTDFYLTEYCYSTSSRDAFVLAVSKPSQARYLRQAYALLASKPYRRVKALLWFLVKDWQATPGDAASLGVYTGLIDAAGVRKPSWWAFAGGNRISITAPSRARARTRFTVSGTLTTRAGVLAGKQLILQRRGLKARKWVKAKTATTKADGSYGFAAYQNRSLRYRVIWNGVCESASMTVRLVP